MKKALIYFIFIVSIIMLFGNWAFSLKKSNKYDRVTAYTSLEETDGVAVFKQFTADTGIKVDWVRLSSGECVARLEAEKGNPQTSVWVGGVGLNHIEAKNKGLTTPYKSPKAINLPGNYKDKDGYWTGIYVNPLSFVSNTNLLKKYNLTAPKSWAEICDPKFKGQVQMANPGSSGTAYNVLVTLIQLFGEDKGFEYIKKLDNNITMYTRSGAAPGKNACLGEVTVAIGYTGMAIRYIADGYPVVQTFPSEGTGFEIASISMVKNGPKKEINNAKALIDFALGESCAKVIVSLKLVPLRDVEGVPVSIKKIKTIKQDDEWAVKEKNRILEKWNQIIGGEVKTEAKK